MDPLKKPCIHRKIILFFVFVFSLSCDARLSPEYLENLEDWRENRLKRLKSETGWLNLAGLYWLEKDSLSLGSSNENDIKMPEGTPPYWGSLVKTDSLFFWYPTDGNRRSLRDDSYPEADRVKEGDFKWYIIKRGNKYGIRLRNLNHPRIAKLDSIPSYPASNNWIKKASFTAFDSARTFRVPTVAGVDEVYTCPGTLSFRHKTEKYSLYPFQSGDNFFIIFGDLSSGVTTYPGGRFLYTEKPDDAETVSIDFNRAYNPPCAFSPYSTCPFPPPENRLDLKITAGEKYEKWD